MATKPKPKVTKKTSSSSSKNSSKTSNVNGFRGTGTTRKVSSSSSSKSGYKPQPTVTPKTATTSSTSSYKPQPTVTTKTQQTGAYSTTSTPSSAVKTTTTNASGSYKPQPTVTKKTTTGSSANSGYYDANKDYAAAIRNATSSTEKSRLIQERQNKINAMNSAGTNAKGYSNSIYSSTAGKSVPTAQRVQTSYVPTVTPNYTQQDYLMRGQSNIDPLSVQGVYAGDGSMSLPDQQLLRSYQKVYNDAKARGDQNGMDAAHQMAEKLRDNYRYYPMANSNGYGLGENDIGFIRDMAVRTDALGNKYVDQYNRNSVTTIQYDKDGNFVNQHTSGNIAAHNARVAEQMAATDRRLALQGKENDTYAVRIGDAADAGLSASALAQKYGGVGNGAGQALYTTTPVTQAIANGESLATQMYGYFDPNMDYAAAIRAETDPARKTQLILERQNKLNYLNATGQNPNGYSNGAYGYTDTQTGTTGTNGYGSYEDILNSLGGYGDAGNTGSTGNGGVDYSYEDFLADFPEYEGMSQEELFAQYNSIAQQMAAQRNALLQQLLDQNQAAQDAASLEFDELARQAYINRRLDENALPQMLAALGISGGGSETANLELLANYQNNLNENERTRQQMLSEYALQALNARQQANSDISGYYANAQQNAMNAWQVEQANRNSYNQWAADYAAAQKQWAASNDLAQKQLAAQLLEAAYNQNMQNQQWQNTLQQQAYEKEWNEKQWQAQLEQIAYEKAQNEKQWQNSLQQQQIELALQTGDYSKLANLGYNTNYLQKLQQAELEQLALEAAQTRAQINKANRSSVTSGSGGGNSKKTTNEDVTPVAPAEMTVTNQDNGAAFYVPGLRWVSYSELNKMVEAGTVQEIVNGSKVTYKKVW